MYKPKQQPYQKQQQYGYNNLDDLTKSNELSYKTSRENDIIDSKYGFDRVKDNTERTGYLINMHSVNNCEIAKFRANLIYFPLSD